MKISILTLFPQMFAGPFTESILKRAQEKKLVEFNLINIRNFGIGPHQMVDDTPFGGGIGMVLKVDILHKALTYAKAQFPGARTKVILTSAAGTTFNQTKAKAFSKLEHLIIICGHYEGVDARILEYVDEEISIGDFVLTGGELPAMLISDSIVRLIDGVITDGATDDESFSQPDQALLEYPHYTKPREYDGKEVPEVLLSGDHGKIKQWRHEQALKKTQAVRPDMLEDH